MSQLIANVVWPALFLTGKLLTIWPIAAGLVVEFFVVRYITNLRGMRCVVADVTMNVASALLGLFLIPFSGILWEFVAAVTIMPLFDWGTFNPVTWGATILIAALINAAVEGAVLRFAFKQSIGKLGFWVLYGGNLVSVSIAYVVLLLYPPEFH